MQTVSLKTAERLRELGYPQNLEVGDYYWATFGGEQGPALVTARTLNRDRHHRDWGDPPIKRGPKLPRLDQVMDEIERLVPHGSTRFFPVTEDLRGCLVWNLNEGLEWMGEGPSDVEAAGVALARILEAKVPDANQD